MPINAVAVAVRRWDALACSAEDRLFVDESLARQPSVESEACRTSLQLDGLQRGRCVDATGKRAAERSLGSSWGPAAHVPAGAVHGFRVESETARYLILTTARHGEFYRAITLPSQPGGLPPAESIEGSEIGKAARQYGIEFIGPLPDET